MSVFKKAEPKQARLKVSVYGPPGSGKTFSTLLFGEGLAAINGKRVAYVDTERGTDFYAQEVKNRKVHPAAFDFDALYTRSLAEVNDAVRGLNPEEYGVVVIDSITHLWEAAMDAYRGKRTKVDSIPMWAWGKIKKPYKDLIAHLIGSPFHVFILGRQKNLFEEDPETENIKKVGVAMRAEGETPYEPHLCLRMESAQDQKDTTKSDIFCYVEKDRTGVLSGSVIRNPDFATIEPLLPLLGEDQAPVENEDERIAKDAELYSESENKKEKQKEEKSRGIFSDMQAKLAAAETLDVLGTVAKEIKKVKRYLLDAHENALREIYKTQREKLVEATAGDI